MDVHPYATQAYAATLAHVGRPLFVPAWGTYVIARDWKDGTIDAIGPYPITCFMPRSDLRAGLETLKQAGLVTLTGVIDGLVGPSIEEFQRSFSIVRPYKKHYLVDGPAGTYGPNQHHRYEIRRAARLGVDVRIVPLAGILDTWMALYEELIVQHRITGAQRFSRTSFEALAKCDGVVAIAAYLSDAMVSCHLWIRYQHYVWSHLAASNGLGYSTGAAYAVYDHAIRHFADCVVNLGGAAGNSIAPDDGLARFKEGFCNRSQSAYLVGSVLDIQAYRRLTGDGGGSGAGEYFPAYRGPPLSEASPRQPE